MSGPEGGRGGGREPFYRGEETVVEGRREGEGGRLAWREVKGAVGQEVALGREKVIM